ncbi:MAG: hypothetical protein VX038_03375 [Verrucomicrobiota bacterium]|nr:hypothetical protein [Verrucomicrobiota bacterium]
MKQILVKYYDKLLVITAFSALAVVFGLQVSEQIGSNAVINVKDDTPDWSRSSDGVILQSKLENDLMPGNFIFYQIDDNNFSQIEISKLIFKRRSIVTIHLVSGKVLKGTIKPKEGIIISKNWKNTNTPILLDIDGQVTPIQMRTIEKIVGTPKYVLSDSADLTVLRDKQPYFYQRGEISFSSKNRKRPVWDEIPADRNSTIYELFTPPLIYIIDNELTATLPEAPIEEKEKEPFGAFVTSFIQKPYRFRLTSWIGNSPYLEDIQLTEKFGRTIRNRLEVNSSYKMVENPKPGRPSLELIDSNSSEKFLTLKYFTVQNVTQTNGGIKPVGRALIEDHSLGMKPFEINSIMENVFLGQFEVKLNFKIGKEDSYEIILTESDQGGEINYNDRIYKVLEFDSEKKSVKLRKVSAIPNQFEDLELLAP